VKEALAETRCPGQCFTRPTNCSDQASQYARQEANSFQKPQEKQGSSAERGTDSGTLTDADHLQTLAAQLAKLSPEDRAKLAALLLGKAGNS
jgi:hypothetical protein